MILDFRRRHVLRWIGNGLIGLSILGLVYTFWPIVRDEWDYRFGKETEVPNQNQGIRLVIPSLKINQQVMPDVDPFDKKIYEKALNEGVAMALGSKLPGERGLTYLFAHSSEAPWLMTRQNTTFYRLGRIKVGGEIILKVEGREYKYKVTELKTVRPTQIDYLAQTNEEKLILQTCTPVGTDWMRLLVIAKLSE